MAKMNPNIRLTQVLLLLLIAGLLIGNNAVNAVAPQAVSLSGITTWIQDRPEYQQTAIYIVGGAIVLIIALELVFRRR